MCNISGHMMIQSIKLSKSVSKSSKFPKYLILGVVALSYPFLKSHKDILLILIQYQNGEPVKALNP